MRYLPTFLVIVFLAGACSRTEISLEQARDFSLILQGSEFQAPPRSISDLGVDPDYDLSALTDVTCHKDPDESVEAILERAKTQAPNSDGIVLWNFRRSVEQAFIDDSVLHAITYADHFRRIADHDFDRGAAHAMLAIFYANRGDLERANRNLARSKTHLFKSRPRARGCRFEKEYQLNRVSAHIAYSREDYEEARIRAEAALAALELQHSAKDRCFFTQQQWRKPELHIVKAKAMAAQGNLIEAEAEIRPYEYLDRTRALNATSSILLDQGRTDDALRVAQASLLTTPGRTCSAFHRAEARESLARALIIAGRNAEAGEQYRRMASELASFDTETWKGRFAFNLDRGTLLAISGQASTALAIFERVERRRREHFPADSKQTIEARALRGLALLNLGHRDEAFDVFEAEMPAAIEKWHDKVSRNVMNASDLWRLRTLAGAYLELLLENGDQASIAKALRLSEAVREHGIQRTYQASIARVLEREGTEDRLIRTLQDTEQLVRNLEERLVVVAGGYGDLDALLRQLTDAREALRTLHAEVEDRYPRYKSLVNPEPVSVSEIQSALGPGEAVLLTFVAENAIHVWGIPKAGPVRSATATLGRKDLQKRVDSLRGTLAPEGVSRLSDIPDFDLRNAYELYASLLAPVRAAWVNADHLIVVADGPLNSLPFGVLVTDKTSASEDRKHLFDRYRDVPWLIEKMSLSRVPSASALVALRNQAATHATAARPFVGFGDPVFRKSDSRETSTGRSTGPDIAHRGIVLRAGPGTRTAASADLSELRRLPETADEIVAVAKAVGADMVTDVYLREAASEAVVKNLSKIGSLSNYRVISFATHGLVPGDLDGLQRPALALSYPGEGEQDDGLLTTDDIIGLKLNADWAVLSACNTAVEAGNTGDAAAGLGRAFFHAGARALLLSNWPVHSESTQALMITLFRRQALQGLTRAAALRSAMLELIDRGGYRDLTGEVVFAYAHPLFWAPFTLVGDGGA